MNSRVIQKYKCTYLCNGFVQDKILVSREDWELIIKPMRKVITIIEDDNKGRSTTISLSLRKSLQDMFIDHTICFPVGSPLHDAIKTGVLVLTVQQGLNHDVKLVKSK